LVYATCSILRAENEEQVEWAQKHFGLSVKEMWKTPPIAGGMDGFFTAVLECTK
jgi:16S rRNA C967 or C1407 C5-methylase (RsmB/RsmF family)